ncbi:reverse transcriptase domain-containing protein [Tanacetum coccineum]
MAKEDEEKMTFITRHGIFCYSKMPFGLKNAGATYQRLVDKAFQKQIGRNLEVYVDDLVIKSRTKQDITRDIEEMFRTLREINMKLNPKNAPSGWRKACSWDTSCIQTNEKANSRAAYTNRTYGKVELIMYIAAVREVYMPSISIKGQILPDFIVERPEDDFLATTTEAKEELSEPWTLFDATNNEAEYEALIAGLRIAEQMGIKNLQANVDSRLVANQVNGSYIAKESGMIQYLEKVKTLASSFKKFSIKQEKARAIRRKSRRCAVINGVLYKKSYLRPWLRCVGPLQENYVLREIHEGSCSMHAETRSMVAKSIRTGYYWPTMHADARKMIRGCQDCQVHRPVPRNPQQKLTPIMSPWPFYKWGIDIAGPFLEGPGKVNFLIVAIDYFTKWIEANPVATITGTTHSKIGVKSCASASTLPPSSIHKPMVWWKEQTEAWEKE